MIVVNGGSSIDVSHLHVQEVGEVSVRTNRDFTILPLIFSSLVQVQTFPSTVPVARAAIPRLLTAKYWSCPSSAL